MRLSSCWRRRWARLAVSLEMSSSSPARSGLTSSAAAVGVGARRSATKSAIVKSVSCPIPVTTGTGARPGFDSELEIAARLVQADERLHLHLHAVGRRPLEILLPLPEHDATHLGVRGLQNETGVSRLGNGEIG